jgi:hypothetical protein
VKYRKTILHTAAIFTVLLTLGLAAQKSQAQRVPDLVITRAVLIDATTGIVSVEIKNKNTGKAGPSKLRLIVWEMGQFEKKSVVNVFTDVPGIGAYQKVNVKITAGVPIISTRYSLFVDISKDVHESNENNNRYEGEAGKS